MATSWLWSQAVVTRIKFVVFCFDRYGLLRHLHSFPTRRSSDLPYRRVPVLRWLSPTGYGRAADRHGARPRHHVPRPARARSEEHTSELQSRENLVCRLLLEKKKKTQQALQSQPQRNICTHP